MENYFILPFTLGMIFLFVVLFIKYGLWITKLSHIDKLRIVQSIFTRRSWDAIKESFMEGLIHRNMYKRNPLLGYMHMCFALGWFLLIVFGHIEGYMYYGTFANAPWIPIFFQYYVHDTFPGEVFMTNLMDFLLLFILSGVLLAYFKRLNSKIFGIKKTTKLKPLDRVALISLWFIFPLRLLAESATAALYGNGGFLTNTVGQFFVWIGMNSSMEMVLWWAYSISLCFFFIGLPFSRYMHILTEILFIFLRHYGIKLKKQFNSYSRIQV